MGIRPTSGVDTVWSEDAWTLALRPKCDTAVLWSLDSRLNAGLDSAAYGDDDSVIHVRCGPLSLHHESHNGWGPDRVAARLKDVLREYAALYNSWASYDRPPLRAEDVLVTIELDGGFGVGVHSHRGGFGGWGGVTVGSASRVMTADGRPVYANTRAEVWCEAAKRAAGGGVDLSRLPKDVLDRLKPQLLTPYYEVITSGARAVESKDEIKKRLRRSPDDADAFLLSHHEVPPWNPEVISRDDVYGV